VAVSAELARRVQVPIGAGETSEEAVRNYLTVLPKRQPSPPKGSALYIQMREYVTEDGLLQPRFRLFVYDL
jgi:hypothetical protein